MKKLSLVIALMVMSVGVFAQASESYKKGQMNFSAGIGLASVLGGTPIYVAGEWAWSEQIGFGASFSRQTYTTGSGFAQFEYSWNLIGVNVIYHQDYLKMANLDTYGRFGLGYIVASGKYTGTSLAGWDPTVESVGGIGYDAGIGAHYYFMPNLGANVELGYGLALLKVGVTYKM